MCTSENLLGIEVAYLFELRSEICCAWTWVYCSTFELQRKSRLPGNTAFCCFLVANMYTFACWKEWVSQWKEHSYVDTLAIKINTSQYWRMDSQLQTDALGVTHARKKIFHTRQYKHKHSAAINTPHHYLSVIHQTVWWTTTHTWLLSCAPNLPEYHPLKDLKSQLHAPTQMGGFAEFLMRPFTHAQISK